ncbi:MAG: NAD(P)-binding domain-containing protein [Bacteroidetes bacterium]|nr:NAD(P)-binding domain-containing protein [Bacteroidota bacterium]
MNKNTIGIIGAGRMGTAMVRQLVISDSILRDRIIATNHAKNNLSKLDTLAIKSTNDNIETVKKSEILILSVRPQQMRELIEEIKKEILPEHIIISIAIGVPLKWLSENLINNKNIFHVHPPSTLLASSKGISFGCTVPPIDLAVTNKVEKLFLNFGEVRWIEESMIDKMAVMAGCSPAFLCSFLEHWKEIAMKNGIDQKTAEDVIEKMFEAIRFSTVENKLPYKEIINNIATPHGVTEEGLKVLEPIKDIFKEVFDVGLKKVSVIKKYYNT